MLSNNKVLTTLPPFSSYQRVPNAEALSHHYQVFLPPPPSSPLLLATLALALALTLFMMKVVMKRRPGSFPPVWF